MTTEKPVTTVNKKAYVRPEIVSQEATARGTLICCNHMGGVGMACCTVLNQLGTCV